MKTVKLIMITTENNNKYYNMTEQADGTFAVEYGRVGATKQVTSYPMSKWDSQLNSKLKKGYEDKTNLFREVETKVTGVVEISDKAVREFFNKLAKFANQSIEENYLVSSKTVTKVMLDEAQVIIDGLFTSVKIGSRISDINNELLNLYKTLPRKMSKVNDHLINASNYTLTTKEEVDRVKKLISVEQENVDVIKGSTNFDETPADTTADAKTTDVLGNLGLEISKVTDQKEFDKVAKMMKDSNHTIKNLFKVTNKKSETKFERFVKKAKNQTTKLFFHGSRNENWYSIIKMGLMIRPANAVHTGSMFGDGVYGANKFTKSAGYSSKSGSYWSGGNSQTGFVAVFEFHVGNQLDITNHTSWCYNLNEKNLKAKGDYDSVFAHGGADLRNDEFIVYNADQATIRYIIEF